MVDWFPIVTILVLFIAVMIVFSKENLDYVAFALLAAFIACFVTSLYYKIPAMDFIGYIEFRPLIFIFSMQIMVQLAEKYRIFQWIAVKTLHMTKGNHRVFFYVVTIISTLTATIIADVTVSLIFIPLVIRACKILKIKAAPYLFAITITINIGSIYTPFSSSENILISDAFGLTFIWFLKQFTVFVILAMGITLVLLDFIMLRKEKPPPEEQKKILLEIMDPNLVISDRKQFLLNSLYFSLVIIGFIFIEQAYLVAFFGALLMSLLDDVKFTESLAKIDWNVIMFFVALFLLIGTMQITGIFITIGEWVRTLTTDNVLVAALVVLILSSLMSGFLANSPTALIFITLIKDVFGPEPPNPILMALLLGINLGGNIMPQGAACDVMTLNIAMKNKVEGFTYKTLLKNGGMFALIHIALCIIYLVAYSFALGYV